MKLMPVCMLPFGRVRAHTMESATPVLTIGQIK